MKPSLIKINVSILIIGMFFAVFYIIGNFNITFKYNDELLYKIYYFYFLLSIFINLYAIFNKKIAILSNILLVKIFLHLILIINILLTYSIQFKLIVFLSLLAIFYNYILYIYLKKGIKYKKGQIGQNNKYIIRNISIIFIILITISLTKQSYTEIENINFNLTINDSVKIEYNGFIELNKFEQNIKNDIPFYEKIKCVRLNECEKKSIFINLSNEEIQKINNIIEKIDELSKLNYSNNIYYNHSFLDKLYLIINFVHEYNDYMGNKDNLIKINTISQNIFFKLIHGDNDLNSKIFAIKYLNKIVIQNNLTINKVLLEKKVLESAFKYKLRENKKYYDKIPYIPMLINSQNIYLVEVYESYQILNNNTFKNFEVNIVNNSIISSFLINNNKFIYNIKDIKDIKNQIKEYNLN